jgi:hypothetical protein
MKASKLLIFLGMLALTACGQFEVRIQPVATSIPTNIAAIPTNPFSAVASPTLQSSPTSAVPAPSPTLALATATQGQQPTLAVPPSTTATEQTVKIVLIELEGNGQSGPLVGCVDSAVPINVTIPPTQGVLKAALEKLFSAKQQYYGESGYYNALYQSDLQVASVNIEQGKAIIHLTGSVMLGGTCDAPRVQAQIEQTALQFSTVNEVAVFVNDVPLEDVLSTK